MSMYRRTAFLPLVLGLGAMRALAGEHLICYEAPAEVRNGQVVLKAIAGCHDDSGQPCTLKNNTTAAWKQDINAWQTSQRVASIGTFGYFEFTGSGSGAGTRLDVSASFVGRTDPIDCTVNAWGTLSASSGAAEGVLTGFSSDVSGLVSTGVWRLVVTNTASNPAVPGDFIASGGGFEAEPGAFVRIADREWVANSPERNWKVHSLTDSLGKPARTTAYAIGLRIQGLNSQRDLAPLLKATLESSATLQPQPVPAPRARVAVQPGQVAIGGGIRAYADSTNSLTLWGQFASASAPLDDLRYLRCVILLRGCAPLQPTGWDAESKDEAGQHPGRVTASLLALPATITVPVKVNGQSQPQPQTFEVRAKMVDRTSAPGTASNAKVDGLRGEYALTQVGGRTLWAAYNPGGNPATSSSRLSAVVPLPEVGGASATATHGSSASVAAVTAYAQGIKLVPVGTPPDVEEAPWKQRTIDIAWWCTVDDNLADSELCTYKGKSIPADQVCATFPELTGWGYCKPEGGK